MSTKDVLDFDRDNVSNTKDAAQFGATHFQEIAFVFYNVEGLGYKTNPFAGMPPSYAALAKTMSTAWVNFVTGLDPNGKGPSGKAAIGEPWWPVYNATTGGGVGRNIVWHANASHIEADTYRAEGIQWMIDHGLDVFGI